MLENIALVNLTDIIEEKILSQRNNEEDNKKQLRIVKEIGRNLIEGLTIQDSCLLLRIEKDLYDKWVEEIPEIGKSMEIQRLTYKSKLIKTLNNNATINGDFKIALQLLMANFPQEFNPAIQKEMEKNSKPKEEDHSTLEEIFSLIQKSDSPIVNKEQNAQTKTENLSIKSLLSEIL